MSVYQFLDFITLDDRGKFNEITQDANGNFKGYSITFKKSLNNLYYNSNPEEFYKIYKSHVEGRKNDSKRQYFYGDDKTIKNTIKRIYKNVDERIMMDRSNTRPAYYVFGLNVWLNIWH